MVVAVVAVVVVGGGVDEVDFVVGANVRVFFLPRATNTVTLIDSPARPSTKITWSCSRLGRGKVVGVGEGE